MIESIHVTASIVKKLLRLAPVQQGVPELADAINKAPEVLRPTAGGGSKKKRCCGGYSASNPPPSAAKNAAAIISGLSREKKLILLTVLNCRSLYGYLPGQINSSVLLATR